MNWVIQKLAGAMIAGIGWKLGADVYDTIKAKLKEKKEETAEEAEADEGGPATGEAPAGVGRKEGEGQ